MGAETPVPVASATLPLMVIFPACGEPGSADGADAVIFRCSMSYQQGVMFTVAMVANV